VPAPAGGGHQVQAEAFLEALGTGSGSPRMLDYRAGERWSV
jgi:hypothetical protein